MFRSTLVSVTTCLIASTAFGQTGFFIPSNTPSSGICNLIPFGNTNTNATWVNQKYQCMATAAQLGNSQILDICDLAFAPCGTGVQHAQSIEIVLAQTNATTLSTNFAANLSANVQTVLSAKNREWHLTDSQWNRIALDNTYQYLATSGKNLVIQVTITGNHFVGIGQGFQRSEDQQRVYAYGWTGAPPATGGTDKLALKFEVNVDAADLHTFGHGCAGSNGVPNLTFSGSGVLGETVGISVANCVANAAVLQAFGVALHPTGIDLGVLGAPGCILYHGTNVVVAGAADASGVYSLQYTIPSLQKLACRKLYTQVFPLDSGPGANSLGLSASNYGRFMPGY